MNWSICLTFLILLFLVKANAQDSSQNEVYKGKKYEVLDSNQYITLYEKVNCEKFYFKFAGHKKIKRLNYYRIIHKNASTYRIRENCRELRRRRIKLYTKHKDGEYFIFKVFSSYIQ